MWSDAVCKSGGLLQCLVAGAAAAIKEATHGYDIESTCCDGGLTRKAFVFWPHGSPW